MKYHLSNNIGLEQNRSRVKCYHFSIISLPYHGSKQPHCHPEVTHYICSVSLSRPESHHHPGCQGGWELQSLFWVDMCCPKYSVTMQEERMLRDNQGSRLYHFGFPFIVVPLLFPQAQNFNQFIRILYMNQETHISPSCVLLSFILEAKNGRYTYSQSFLHLWVSMPPRCRQ